MIQSFDDSDVAESCSDLLEVIQRFDMPVPPREWPESVQPRQKKAVKFGAPDGEENPEVDEEPEVEEVQSKQRKTVRLYPRGSQVEIYSASQQRWIPDGEVVEVVWESGVRDNIKVSAGSTKIVYGQGAHFKWVASHRLPAMVRKSRRPVQPAPWKGDLLMSTGFLGLNEWVNVEVCGGVLRWSADLETIPGGGFSLLGTKVEKTGVHVKLRTNGTRFQALRAADADAFAAALRVHAEYCEKDASFISHASK